MAFNGYVSVERTLAKEANRVARHLTATTKATLNDISSDSIESTTSAMKLSSSSAKEAAQPMTVADKLHAELADLKNKIKRLEDEMR